MNEKLARYMRGFEHKYPHNLEARYERVLNKIVELWGTEQIDDYFSELLIPARLDRQGFPPEVAAEIFELTVAYDEILRRASDDVEDVWGSEERAVKEQDGIEELEAQYGTHKLLHSVENGDFELCALFLKSGMPVDTRDSRDWTPLMIAAFNGNEEMAALLIKHGASVFAKDFGGYTPLHWSAFNGYVNVTALLVNKGAEVNAKSKYGLTPLIQACARGHTDVVAQLLDMKANPNSTTDDGSTALLKAVANGYEEIVALLLNAGASRFIAHRNGSTPFSLAKKGQSAEILRLMNAVQTNKPQVIQEDD